MKKLLLEADFDYDFDLFALVTPIRDYRLCWLLNKLYQFDFVRRKDLEINHVQHQKLTYFSIFSYNDILDKVAYFVINNKHNNEYLVPELKQADFFLLIKGTMTEDHQEVFQKRLKDLQPVQTFFEVNPFSLRSKQNLIFDESDLQQNEDNSDSRAGFQYH